MKYLSKIQKVSYYYFLLSLCMVQGQGLKYNLFPPTPVLNDIYITDQEESYTLVLEFSCAIFYFLTNEYFAPASLTLLFKNVKWGKGNFTKKCEQNPLYQYSLSVPRNVNQKEMDFTKH